MLVLSILSYKINNSQEYIGHVGEIETFKHISNDVKFIPSLLTRSKTIALLSKNGKTLYLAFAGTHDINDAIKDIDFNQVLPDNEPLDSLRKPIDIRRSSDLESCHTEPCGLNIKFHDGFYDQCKGLCTSITKAVEEFITNGGENIVLTGHSSGGCVASMIAYYLVKELTLGNISVITFGSPYFTNKFGAKWFELNTAYTRVIINRDPIPNLPKFDPLILEYEHVDASVFIKHGRVTTYIKKKMTLYRFIKRIFYPHTLHYHKTATYLQKLNAVIDKL